ncbi:MAG: serine/threonine-protein kinase, partial [Planctomycetota bacterium]
RSMSELAHPNLCRVVDVSIQGETPNLAMEWVEGRDLRTAWARLGRRQRLGLFLKIVDAVAAAHAAGVVHADLKPDNILVNRRGEPTIVDFGLSRSERDGPMGLHTDGGTPGYAPPECFDRSSTVTAESDVFSLGVLLFELMTDRTPWPDDMAPALLVKQMAMSDPPLPEQFAPDTPPDLQRICLAALERRPEARYRSAEELAADLRRSLRRETVAARPTMLARRFDAQVRRTIDATREWLRLGLVTPEAAGAMLSRLNGMARAESPWVADARRVTSSQAVLQAGGGVTIVAAVVGLGLAGPLSGGAWVQVAAWVLAMALAVLGVMLIRRGEQRRVGAGILWSATLAAPAAAWLTVDRVLRLGGEPVLPVGVREWIGAFLGTGITGPTHAQLAVIASVGVVMAALGRAAARTSAFTLAGFVFSFAVWIGLVKGIAPALPLSALAVLFGFGALGLGLNLDWDEQRAEREGRAVRGRPRDARALLGSAALCVVVGAVAVAEPLGRLIVHAMNTTPDTSAAGAAAIWGWGAIAGAAFPAVLAVLSSRRATPIRSVVTEAARAVAAFQVLVGVVLLEYAWALGDASAASVPWFWVLLTLSLGAGVLAVRTKWRSVLIASQIGLCVWTVRLLAEAPTASGALWRAGVAAGVGVTLMLLAWRLPIWRERRRLRRWSKARRLHDGEPPSASWG